MGPRRGRRRNVVGDDAEAAETQVLTDPNAPEFFETMAASGKPDQNYGVEMYGFPDFVHVPAKKAHYDTWSTRSSSGCSSGSSPNHLDELHVDIPHSSTPSVASTSTASHPSADTTLNVKGEVAPSPTFADLKPVAPKSGTAVSVLTRVPDTTVVSTSAFPAEVPQLSAFPSSTQTGLDTVAAPDTVVPVAPVPIRPSPTPAEPGANGPEITHDARFSSYAEFEDAFEAWKRKCLHPFRVASSETLREPDGTVNHRFKYRYVVFHCAHYGEPRMRGIGKRPNQHYLPSGCRAMLRLNYSFSEQLLKITTLHDEHLNHEVSAEMYRKVSAKLKRSSIGTPSPANKRQKMDSPAPSPYNQDSSLNQNTPLATNPPLHGNTPTSGASALAQMSLSQSNQMANMAIALQQQQIMASLLNQQKENINLATGLSSLGIPRPQPSMINILSMMGLQQRLLLQQPAYGLVAPLTQQVTSPPEAQSIPNSEGKPNVLDREAGQRYSSKNDLPAPVAVKPNYVSATSQVDSSPPHLVPEVPVTAEQTVSSTTPSTTATLAASFEESLARLRSGTHDAELMNRIAQLNSLSTFWGAPTIPEFR
uniref:Protein T24C4.2 n=2 Tax=Haemonchus contortus TaxID=6289 RepID=A0A912MEE3_HAECO